MIKVGTLCLIVGGSSAGLTCTVTSPKFWADMYDRDTFIGRGWAHCVEYPRGHRSSDERPAGQFVCDLRPIGDPDFCEPTECRLDLLHPVSDRDVVEYLINQTGAKT